MGKPKFNLGMRLHDEWRWIVGHSWSFRMLGLAAVFSGAQAALPLFMDHPPLPRRIFAVVVFLIVSLAMIFGLIVAERPPVIIDPAIDPDHSEPVPAPASVAAPAPAIPAAPPAPVAVAPAAVAAPEPASPAAPAQAPIPATPSVPVAATPHA